MNRLKLFLALVALAATPAAGQYPYTFNFNGGAEDPLSQSGAFIVPSSLPADETGARYIIPSSPAGVIQAANPNAAGTSGIAIHNVSHSTAKGLRESFVIAALPTNASSTVSVLSLMFMDNTVFTTATGVRARLCQTTTDHLFLVELRYGSPYNHGIVDETFASGTVTLAVGDTITFERDRVQNTTYKFYRNSTLVVEGVSAQYNHANVYVSVRGRKAGTPEGMNLDNMRIDTLPPPPPITTDVVAPVGNITRVQSQVVLNVPFTLTFFAEDRPFDINGTTPKFDLDSMRLYYDGALVRTVSGIEATSDTIIHVITETVAGNHSYYGWAKDSAGNAYTTQIYSFSAASSAASQFVTMAYYPGWNLSAGDVRRPDETEVDWFKINYTLHFGLVFSQSTQPYFDTLAWDYRAESRQNIIDLINAVHAANGKILLSLNIVPWYGGSFAAFDAIKDDSLALDNFATFYTNYAKNLGYDGVEYNFEFPEDYQRAGFSRLMRITRRKLNAWPVRGTLVHTIYIRTGTQTAGNYDGYEIASVDTSADFHLMELYACGYGHWNQYLGYSVALDPPNMSDGDPWDQPGGIYDGHMLAGNAIKNHTWSGVGNENSGPPGLVRQGWSRNKMVIGLGFGYYWYQNAIPLRIGGGPYGNMSYSNFTWFNIGDVYTNNATEGVLGEWGSIPEYWDDDAKVHLKFWTTGGVSNFLAYEDSLSLALKTRRLIDSAFAGVGIYEVGGSYLGGYPSLLGTHSVNPSLDAIYNVVSSAEPVLGPPLAVTLKLPAANDTLVNAEQIQFSWTGAYATSTAAAATSYILQIYDNVNLTGTPYTSPVTDTVVIFSGPLQLERQYYWRVTSVSATHGTGGTTAIRMFKTNDPNTTLTLGPPVLSSPANGANLSTNSTTLVWSDTNAAHAPQGYTPTFMLDVATDAGFTSLIVNAAQTGNTLYALPVLQPSMTYHWRVKVFYGNAISVNSPARTFNTPASVPPDTTGAGPYAPWSLVAQKGGKTRNTPLDEPWLERVVTDAQVIAKGAAPMGHRWRGSDSYMDESGTLRSVSGSGGAVPQHGHSLTSSDITGVTPTSKGGFGLDFSATSGGNLFPVYMGSAATVPFQFRALANSDMPNLVPKAPSMAAGNDNQMLAFDWETLTWYWHTDSVGAGGGGTNLGDATPDTARANVRISDAGGDLYFDSSKAVWRHSASDQGEIAQGAGFFNIRKSNGSGRLLIDHAANNTGIEISNTGGGGGRDSIMFYQGEDDGENPFVFHSASAAGDMITWMVQDHLATTNATPTTFYTLAIPASTAFRVEVVGTARRTGGTAGTAEDCGTWHKVALFKNVAGTATQVGATQTIGADLESQAGWDVTISGSSGNIIFQATGATDNNIAWKFDITYRRATN